MHSIDPAAAQAAALQQLAEIQEDPPIQRLALRYAGHPALASDGLQRAFYAVARQKNLEQIKNLRAYFCKVLVREIHHERSQLGAVLVDDFARVAEACREGSGCCPASLPAVDDEVCTSVQGKVWLERFAAQRDLLQAGVPARSDDLARYRAVICLAAEQVLLDSLNGDASDADTNEALRAAYPEYFAELGVAVNTCHQRFRRAREDVKALLQTIVDHDELT